MQKRFYGQVCCLPNNRAAHSVMVCQCDDVQ